MTQASLTQLCLLLHPSIGKTDIKTLFQDLNKIDWEGLVNLAGQYNLIPILYGRLKTLDILPFIPESLTEHLRVAYLANATRNMLLLHEAGFIFTALKNAGIPAVGLKGLFLLENVYADIGMRQMSDLDIMLHKTHIPQALNALETLGYQPTTYFDIRNENVDIKHVPPLIKPEGPYYLELHWTILEENEPFTINTHGLWDRAMPAIIADVDTLALSPEDLVMHLCLHLTYQHHLKLGLRGLYDIALVIDHYEKQLNWEKLIQIGQEWGAARLTWLTLILVEEIFKGIIPPNVLDQMEPRDAQSWVLNTARLQLLAGMPSGTPITPDIVNLATEKGLLTRLKLILSRIFLPKTTLARIYNISPTSYRIYGCYFQRFWGLLRGYAPTIKRVFQADDKVFEDVKNEQTSQQLKTWMTNNQS